MWSAENLDNLAYMHYYDHRNDSLLLYDTYAIPMRDMKKQFVVQYGMKNQDALELIKALSEAPDLYSRRNMLAKAIHAHMHAFQTAQMVRQWLIAVRQMTTQHVHKQVTSKQTHNIRAADKRSLTSAHSFILSLSLSSRCFSACVHSMT